MKKFLLGLGVLLVVLVAVLFFVRRQTKSYSPESSVDFEDGNLKISVFYNRPLKKGRVIFGGLVPYGKTWRTGANEATVFKTNKDLMIGGKKLKAGEYSLWTVPNEHQWTIVFNTDIPNWGIDVMNNGEAARVKEYDYLVIDEPVVTTSKEFEQFTISVDKVDDMLELVLAWDTTLVSIPFTITE